MRPRPCLLCGAEDQETAFLIVRWREPLPGNPPVAFTPLPRCVDRAGCRKRVEAQLDPVTKKPGQWDVLDAGEAPFPPPASNPKQPSTAPAGHAPTLEEVFG